MEKVLYEGLKGLGNATKRPPKIKYEIMIDNNGDMQFPAVVSGARWETRRAGSPSKLTFDVMNDENLNFQEGNPVRLTVDGVNMFFGFVFKKKRRGRRVISVTCYDQMRYLKNKDTYIYTEKTASDVIRMIANDFELNLGSIANTNFVIPNRDENNTALVDIINTALDFELVHTGNLFVLFDDFGRLTLRDIADMKVDLIIDENTGQIFNYESSINRTTANRVKLVFENNETGMRDIYIVQDGRNIDRWGILQYYGTLQEGENGEAKAAALLDLFNAKTRRLELSGVFGDTRIRAGSMPVIDLDLGDITVRNNMLVEKCTHILRESEHWMDLTLRGGDIHG